jgi:hypothetical protein
MWRGSFSVLSTIAVVASLSGCDFGGLNQNQQIAGNQDDGVNLSFGDIAVDPSGTYFLSRNEGGLVHGNILTGGAKVLPGVQNPTRLAFNHEQNVIYVTVEREGGDELIAYDVSERKTLWSLGVNIEDKETNTHGVVTFPLVQVTDDNQHLILTHKREVEILDLDDGDVTRSEVFGDDVVDIDVTPDGSRILVTTEHEWVNDPDGDTPETQIQDVPTDPDPTIDAKTIKVPNCADELVVAPDGEHAFLAPTTCNKDPISVINLDTNEFVVNLPGFGPVAMSPDGEDLVGFLDLEEVDKSLFEDSGDIPSDGRYHMMFIDASTLQYDFLSLGGKLPRYAITPDGKVLLVDTVGWFDDERLRVVDIKSRSIHTTSGPAVQLNDFVITSDSADVFLLDEGLFNLDISDRKVSSIGLDFDPENINITPNDSFLLLREKDTKIQVFDVAKGSLVRAVEF